MIAIAAVSSNGYIGKGSALPWPKIPQDFKFFRIVTQYNVDCVVGARTYIDLPKLPKRKITLVSNRGQLPTSPNKNGLEYSRVIRPSDIPSLASERCVCIGGAKTYELCFPYCSDLLLTIVKKDYEGDVELPEFSDFFKPYSQLYTDENIDIIHYAKKN
jgi:dihydrofolate reductase